ncbi:MAG TPA: hypothetical protein VEL47_07110 [Myxococcota bacterium]|nr:hypothetical protein [Myxococcota bacterium]
MKNRLSVFLFLFCLCSHIHGADAESDKTNKEQIPDSNDTPKAYCYFVNWFVCPECENDIKLPAKTSMEYMLATTGVMSHHLTNVHGMELSRIEPAIGLICYRKLARPDKSKSATSKKVYCFYEDDINPALCPECEKDLCPNFLEGGSERWRDPSKFLNQKKDEMMGLITCHLIKNHQADLEQVPEQGLIYYSIPASTKEKNQDSKNGHDSSN